MTGKATPVANEQLRVPYMQANAKELKPYLSDSECVVFPVAKGKGTRSPGGRDPTTAAARLAYYAAFGLAGR